MGTANRLACAALTLLAAIAVAVTAEAPAAGAATAHPTVAGCAPPTAGRVALWRGEGTAEDSAAAHDGTLRSDAGFGPGIVGQAFALGGDMDHVTVPDAGDLDVTGDVTLDAWVRLDDENFGAEVSSTGIGGDRIILWKVAMDRYASYALWIEAEAPHTAAAAPLGFFHGDQSVPGNRAYSSDLAWQRDRWYHLAVTRTGNAIAFYREASRSAAPASPTLRRPRRSRRWSSAARRSRGCSSTRSRARSTRRRSGVAR